MFCDQSWPDKELVVVETYHDEPSAFFRRIAQEDPRLKYIAIKRPVGEDLTVGAKRNLTILLASGQLLCQLRWWWFICQQVCGAGWWVRWRNGPWWRWRCQVGTISLNLEALQGIRNPTHGIQKIRMKWMRFCTAMVLAMCTSGWWLIFPLSQPSLCWGCTFHVETPAEDWTCWTHGRCWRPLPTHRPFHQQYTRPGDLTSADRRGA